MNQRRALAPERCLVGMLFRTKHHVHATPDGILAAHIARLGGDPRIDARDYLRGHAYGNAFLQCERSPTDHQAGGGGRRIYVGVSNGTAVSCGRARQKCRGGPVDRVCRGPKSRLVWRYSTMTSCVSSSVSIKRKVRKSIDT